MMRLAFFGATQLGHKCAESLVANGTDVIAIFTIPKEFDIRYSESGQKKDFKVDNVLHADFSDFTSNHNIPVYSVNKDLKDYYEIFSELKPDFILCVGWYYLIPDKFIQLAKKGATGIHASLLPLYRGNAPLVWAMINGEKETGVTFFYFGDGVDNGDIIGQEKFSIDDNDTIKECLVKVEQASVKLLEKYVPLIEKGTAPKIKQDESKARYFPKRSPEDGLINMDWDAGKIKNFIRAQTKPYPGAYIIIGNKKIIIWNAEVQEM